MTDKLYPYDFKRPMFEEIALGHKFRVTGAGRRKKDSKFKCAFCGGIGVRYYELTRDDSKKFLVGETCLGRVGLNAGDFKQLTMTDGEKAKYKGKVKPVPKVTPKVLEPIPDIPKDDDYPDDALDDFIDSLRSDK